MKEQTMTAPTTTDPLTPVERQGLMIWGEAISAQIRTEGGSDVLALHIRDDAPRIGLGVRPAIVPASDVAKLRALLNEAATR